MSNIRPGAALVKRPKANALALQQQRAFNKLEAQLAGFSRLPEREKKRLLPALKRLWTTAQQPATADDIDVAVMFLLSCFPHLERSDLEPLTLQVIDDVRAQRPTQYELAWACTKVRRTHEWFSCAKLLKALRTAKRRTARVGLDVFGRLTRPENYDQLLLDPERGDFEFLASPGGDDE